MRLVCPNCDAEYEVDAAVIPDGGRDVQCSNCGHAWFQLPPEAEAAEAAEAALFDAPPEVTEVPMPDAPVAEVRATASVEPEDLLDEDEAAEAAAAAAAALPQRSIDESVLAVLKEEAERELQARKTEPPPVVEEVATAAAAGAASRRIARLKGAEPEPERPQTRSEMLPEIEELNSTLRSSGEKRGGDADAVAETMTEPKARRSGFRSGFTLMVVLACIIIAVYLMAPRLAQQFPAAAPALTAYVALIDQLRAGLDAAVKSAIGFLNGLIGKAG